MNFLIVGHTHNILDQYFSVLSKAIGNCRWIGSPFSLVNLFDKCHSADKDKPGLQREVRVIYDVVKAWAPYLNGTIKYYNIPHCFKFSLKHGFAVMQWKQLSTDIAWKPKLPPLEAEVEVSQNLVSSIIPMEYGIAGTVDQLYRLIGVEEVQPNVSSSALVNASQSKELAAIARMTPVLHELSLSAAHQQNIRLVAQESQGKHGTTERFVTSRTELAEFQRYCKAHSDNEEGLIMWINHDKAENENLAELKSVVPDVLHLLAATDYLNYGEGSQNTDTVTKATYIASVCSRVLKHVEEKFVTKGHESYCYEFKALTEDEHAYYMSRKSPEAVLTNLKLSLETEVESNPYSLFPSHQLPQQIQETLTAENEVRHKAVNDQLNQLNKARYRNFTSVEFIPGPGGRGRGGRGGRGGGGRGGGRVVVGPAAVPAAVVPAAAPAAGGRGRGRGRAGGNVAVAPAAVHAAVPAAEIPAAVVPATAPADDGPNDHIAAGQPAIISTVLIQKRKATSAEASCRAQKSKKLTHSQLDRLTEFQYHVENEGRKAHKTVFCCCVTCFSDPEPVALLLDDLEKCLESKKHYHLKRECYNASRACSLCLLAEAVP